jgi:hypothetical protein
MKGNNGNEIIGIKTMKIETINDNNNPNIDENGKSDELSEYLEYISRTTPTTMPEWMN